MVLQDSVLLEGLQKGTQKRGRKKTCVCRVWGQRAGLIHNSVTDSCDPGVPTDTGEQLTSYGSCPLEHLPGRAAHPLHPPPTPQGAFLSSGAGVAGAAVVQDPQSSAFCLPCCAHCGFLSDHLRCPGASVLPNQNNSVMLRLWMLQSRGVAQPGAEQQRCCGVQGRLRGVQSLGRGRGTGTVLALTWDEMGRQWSDLLSQ